MAGSAWETLILDIEVRLGPKAAQELRALQQELEKTAKAGEQAGKQLGSNVSGALDGIGRAEGKTTPGLKRVAHGLSQLALQSVGVTGPLGSVISTLSGLAVGSVIVTGVAAGIALIAKAFDTLKDAAERAKASLRTTIDAAVEELRAAGLQVDAVGILQAEATQTRREEMRLRIEREDVRIKMASANATEMVVLLQKEAELTTKIAEAETKRVVATTRLSAATREATKDQATKTKQTEAEAKAAAALAAAERARAEALQDRVRVAQSQAAAGLAELANDPLGVRIAETEAKIAALKDEIEDLGKNAPAELVALLAAFEKLDKLLKQVRDSFIVISEELPKIDQGAHHVPGTLGRATGVLPSEEAGTGQAEIDKARLERLQKESEKLQLISLQIQQAAGGALDLARAFGEVGAETAALLDNILQTGLAIPQLVEGIRLIQAGGSALSAITAGLAVIGGIASIASSLFGGGESPEEKAQKELLQKNTEALDRLRAGLDRAGGNVTGTQRTAAFNVAFAAAGMGDLTKGHTALEPILRQNNLSWAELVQIAKDFNITLDGSTQSFLDLQAAIATTDLKLFAKTFAGIMDQISIRGQIFDQTPLQTLQAQAAAAAAGSPALKGLAGLDLSTQAGRDAAEKVIQAAFENAVAGHIDLGNMTLEDLKQILQTIEAGIDEQNKAAAEAAPENQSFTLSRSITEVTGERLGSLMASANFYAERTANAVEFIAAAMSSGGGISFVGGAPQNVEQINRSLGDKTRISALTRGNTVVT